MDNARKNIQLFMCVYSFLSNYLLNLHENPIDFYEKEYLLIF